ncbi:MAG: fatty acid desaturase family protein [Candidatus Binatia bacterium]
MTMSAATIDETTGARWREALSREDIRALLEKSDLRAGFSILFDWAVVFAAMAAVVVWPNPLTVVAALFLIGARQLGFAVLMHEAAHRALFSSRALNDWAGNWLCAYPIWSDMRPYRAYHLQHHAKTGGSEDPDLGLVTPFPITRRSLARKVWRDLSGQTGIKFARGAWKRTFGRYGKDPIATSATRGVVVTNGLLLVLLGAAGHPELWLLWAAAWLTTHTLVTRIRSIAEHALTPDAGDPLNNVRTTLARWWERLLIAPNNVNYHLEHHLLMTVPHYNLRRMHRLLRGRGALDDACVERSYWMILRRAASKSDDGRSAEEPASRPEADGFFSFPSA